MDDNREVPVVLQAYLDLMTDAAMILGADDIEKARYALTTNQ